MGIGYKHLAPNGAKHPGIDGSVHSTKRFVVNRNTSEIHHTFLAQIGDDLGGLTTMLRTSYIQPEG